MNKKKKVILILIAVLLIGSIAIGVSYAYWRLSIRQEDTNRYTSSCFNVSIDLDKDAPITLNNAYPMSDEDGMKLEPYTFTIENTCDVVVNYSIQLNVLSNSTLDSKYVKYAIGTDNLKNVGVQKEVVAKISGATAYEIKTGEIYRGQKQEFKLRLWLDQYTLQSEGMNKNFQAKIVVDTNAERNIYADASGAEKPDLNNGLIPVIWNGSDWEKADLYSNWYDYDHQWWANAVTVSSSTRNKYTTASANTRIKMDDIETMWVWVPRYEYQHTNLGDQYAGGTQELPGGITINFISKDTITPSSDNFTIHDAFWWDNNNDGAKEANEQLSGIWVAKFEMSTGNTACTPDEYSVNGGCDRSYIKPFIKPNVTSWRGARIGTMWAAIHNNMNGTNNTYGLTNSDTHLMKNMEWGAVAYLSQSKYGKYGNANYIGANKEIYINNSGDYYTGRSSGVPSSDATSNGTYSYDGRTCTTATCNTETMNKISEGYGASTTGNIYGIYDMSGGAIEYVMGVMKESTNTEPAVGQDSAVYNSGFGGKLYNGTEYSGVIYGYLANGHEDSIGSKYYDLYDYGTDSNGTTRYHKGDATYETNGWQLNRLVFVQISSVFFYRGGESLVHSGVFYTNSFVGSAGTSISGRPVLVAQP